MVRVQNSLSGKKKITGAPQAQYSVRYCFLIYIIDLPISLTGYTNLLNADNDIRRSYFNVNEC